MHNMRMIATIALFSTQNWSIDSTIPKIALGHGLFSLFHDYCKAPTNSQFWKFDIFFKFLKKNLIYTKFLLKNKLLSYNIILRI